MTYESDSLIDRLIKGIDGFSRHTGQLIAWLTLFMVLITTYVVIMRYGFDKGSIALQESVTYMHGIVFMLGAAYTLEANGHVRVDILYRRFSARNKAWINAIGGILLALPIAIFMGVGSWEFVKSSWAVKEISADAGGLPWVYWLKTLIPLMALTLSLQLIADVLRNLLTLMQSDRETPDH
ncbi:MAG: TRAP transporter small permease subunit [Cellvibrio sp.]